MREIRIRLRNVKECKKMILCHDNMFPDCSVVIVFHVAKVLIYQCSRSVFVLLSFSYLKKLEIK